MRINRATILQIVAAVLLVACQEKEPQTKPEPGVEEQSPLCFKASLDDTRTVLAGKNTLHWTADDAIALFAGEGKAAAKYTNELVSNSPEASFKGSGAVKDGELYRAASPFGAVQEFSGSTVKMLLKSSQVATTDSFDPECGLLYAQSGTTELHFKHAVAYVQFSVSDKSPALKSVSLESLSGSALSGSFSIDCGSGAIHPSEGQSSARVSLSSGGSFAKGRYCIAVLPGTYQDGLEFSFVTSDSEKISRTLTGPLQLEKGTLMDIGEVLLPTTEYEKVKLMYFNVRTANSQSDIDSGHGWDTRKSACGAMLGEQMPDVVGLNEATSQQWSDLLASLPGYKIVESISDNSDNNHIIYNSARVEPVAGNGGKFWLGPTPESENLGWSGYSSRARTCIYTQFKMKDSAETFWFFLTHPSSEDGYDVYKGLELIASKIGTIVPAGEVAVLGGDLNCREKSGSLLALRTSMACAGETAPDAYTVPTYNNWGASSAILDHIFVRGKLNLLSYKTIDSAYEGVTYISDHYPVVAELKINTPSEWPVPVPVQYSDVFESCLSFGNATLDGTVSEQKVVIAGNEYPSLKLGTAEKTGTLSFNPPVMGDFDLSFFAFSWGKACSKVSVTVSSGGSIDGKTSVSFSPRPNFDCSSHTSVIDPYASDKYVFHVKGATARTTLSISVSKPDSAPDGLTPECRSLVFGVNIAGGSEKPADDKTSIDPLTPRNDWIYE